MILSIISAIGENREIGEKNNLLWNLPADMKHFKETTSGHVVIMGLKTFESIGRPLPNRRNIVLAQNYNIQLEGVEIFNSVESLLDNLDKSLNKDEEVFVIGGGQIYKLFINMADRLYITHVNKSFPNADVFFPEIDSSWSVVSKTNVMTDSKNNYDFYFSLYERLNKKT